MSFRKNLDFTLPAYHSLLSSLIEFHYRTCTVSQYMANSTMYDKGRVAVLRHDVDRRPLNALKMAQLEHKYGITSTYYFRSTKTTFKPSIIREIKNCGHEIGYHYETLSKAKGNYKEALEMFEEDLGRFEPITDIKTICMHGSPLSKWDNRDLWRQYSYEDFGIIGEPYLSIDYSKITYLSDTGRTWNPERYNIRDKTDSRSTPATINTTSDLITFLKKNEKPCLIQTHPERWSDNTKEFVVSLASDSMVNMIKQILIAIRGS